MIHDKLRWTRHQVHFSSTTAKFTETSNVAVHFLKDHNALAGAVVCSVLAGIPLGHGGKKYKNNKLVSLLIACLLTDIPFLGCGLVFFFPSPLL